MEGNTRKRRTHEEVVAAREAYAAERHRVQQEKQAKKLERQKIQEERAKRKAERAKKLAEGTTARSKKKKKDDLNKDDSYKGKVDVGDIVSIRFAGIVRTGKVVAIRDTETPTVRGVVKLRLYVVSADGYRYPVGKERIIENHGKEQ